MVITGYRINSTDVREIEYKLNEIKDNIQELSKKTYNKQLGKEIAFLSDAVALNILSRSDDESIYESAVNGLMQKIKIAGITGISSEYNYQVYAHIMPLEEYTYIKVTCANSNLLKCFKKIENYSLSESECEDKDNKKTITWEKLHGIYQKNEPLAVSLGWTVAPDKEKIVYPSLNERCSTIARHNVQNRILSQLSAGEQIPPYRLMEYFDETIGLLSQSEYQRMIKEKEMELKQILPDLRNDDSFVYKKAD